MVMDYASWMVRFRLLPKTQGYPAGTPAQASGTTIEVPFRMLVNAPDRVLLEWFQDHPRQTTRDAFPDNLVSVVNDILVVLTTAVNYFRQPRRVRVSCYRLDVGHCGSATFDPGEWKQVRNAIWYCVNKAKLV